MIAWHCPRCGRRWTTGTTVAALFHECRARRLQRTIALPTDDWPDRESWRAEVWGTAP